MIDTLEPINVSQIAEIGPPIIIPIPESMSSATTVLADAEKQLIAHMTTPLVVETLGNPLEEIAKLVGLLRQLPNHPASLFAWFNLGRLQGQVGHHRAAIAAYDAVLEKKPDFGPAIVNKAVMLEACGEAAAAIDLLQDPSNQQLDVRLAFLNQRGRMLELAGRLQEAEASLLQSLMLDHTQADVIHHFTHLRAKQCRWPTLINLPALSAAEQQAHMGSLGTISHVDDPMLHYNISREWVERKYPHDIAAHLELAQKKLPSDSGRRLRVGFLSSDFRMHVVSIIAVEFFESLDHTQLETFAFDFSPADGTAFRQRVLDAFEHHIPIHADSDEIAARRIADAQLDVLVDLNGITSNARPGILRRKPAPIIMSWLGSLTTTGMKEVDYFVTDRYVFTEENRRAFSEKPVFLETGMHLNANDRVFAPTPTRSEYGLPENAFVYCAFNNNFKINPEVLSDWVEIVRAVPDSVLWLQADNEWSEANLRREVTALGLETGRLVFAKRVMPDQYLARYKLADLYLDTTPCNAGATAIDCLFAGLPILTAPGRSVPARTAAGIVTHAGVPELIAESREAYKRTAISWGRDRVSFDEIRQKVAWEQVSRSKLFDTKAKAQDFAAMLYRVVEGHSDKGSPSAPEKSKRKRLPKVSR